MSQFIVLPLVGFLIGLLIVSLGGGGGALYAGILTVFLNVPPSIAAATSLATTIPTTAMGTFSHWRAGNVNRRLGSIMLLGGVVGAVVGSLCSGLLPQDLYGKLTGVILLLLAIRMLILGIRRRMRGETPQDGTTDGPLQPSSIVKAACFGMLGGAMSGLVGLSGGGPVVAGLMVLGCSALETVGTSVFALCGIAIVGFLAHLGFGDIDWPLVGSLTIGTVAGAFLGPVLLKRLDRGKLEKVLQPALFLMIAVMGVMELFK